MADDEIIDNTTVKMAQVDKLCTALEHKHELLNFIRKQMNVKKPKSKLKVPTIQDIIAHTRNSNVSTKKYFTTGRTINRARDVSKEECPFSSHRSDNFLSSISFKPPKVVKNRPKHAYKYEYKNNDILDRIHIPIDLSSIPQSKVDNNAEHFTLTKGRPIKEKFEKRKFAINQRRCFFKKLCTGFLEDEIKKQEEHHIRDLWRMYTIREELDKIIQSFEDYLSEDHQESVKIIEESQQIAQLKEKKLIEEKRSSAYLTAIKCHIYKMQGQLEYRKYCKEAIYQISPTHWQEEFEKTKEEIKPKAQEMAEEVYEHYQDYLTYTPVDDKLLDKLVHDLTNDIINLGPPNIYFQFPWEVDMVLKEFELQNLHAAKHLADVGNIQKDLKKLLKHVKEYYQIEFNCLQEKIRDLEAGILYQKERSLELESIAKELTQTVFKDVVSADHILETQGLVRNMYEEIIGDADTKMSYVDMMEKVETEIVNVWNAAHEIPKFKYEEYEEKLANKMKEETAAALEAKRRERTIVLTVDRINRSYLCPQRRLYKRLAPRSEPPQMLKRYDKMKMLKKLKQLETKQGRKGDIWDDRQELDDKKYRIKSQSKASDEASVENDDIDSIEPDKDQISLSPKVISCRRKHPKINKPSVDLRFEIQPKIAVSKYTIPEILDKFKEIEEGGFVTRIDSKITESSEALPLFKSYNYNFERLRHLHQSLLDRIRQYQERPLEYDVASRILDEDFFESMEEKYPSEEQMPEQMPLVKPMNIQEISSHNTLFTQTSEMSTNTLTVSSTSQQVSSTNFSMEDSSDPTPSDQTAALPSIPPVGNLKTMMRSSFEHQKNNRTSIKKKK